MTEAFIAILIGCLAFAVVSAHIRIGELTNEVRENRRDWADRLTMTTMDTIKDEVRQDIIDRLSDNCDDEEEEEEED